MSHHHYMSELYYHLFEMLNDYEMMNTYDYDSEAYDIYHPLLVHKYYR